MKKSFPLILILITVSLLGIIAIQVSWIYNSLKVKTEELRKESSRAVIRVADKIVEQKKDRYKNISLTYALYGNSVSVKKIYTDFELRSLIKQELSKGNIKLEFEYSVRDDLGKEIMNSSGFKTEYYQNINVIPWPISDNESSDRETLFVYLINPENYINKKILSLLLSSLLFTAVIISAFALTFRTLIQQKKISEIKNDFIANMTHEFKTPIATIALATDALKNEKVKNDPEKLLYYTEIIKEENRRMNKQVETILNAAQLERQEIKLTLKKINVHEIINQVYENMNINVEEKGGILKTSLKANNPYIKADEVHFSNIVFNLLDNAIKYSSENPEINISTENIGNTIHIQFQDNGIGMSKDTLNKIFEKFYRAHTGNLHNVKGFGLGLSYVKQIVDAHDGKIKVTSTPGKGSTFTVSISNA